MDKHRVPLVFGKIQNCNLFTGHHYLEFQATNTMTTNLLFYQAHKSIKSLTCPELPGFTVLTGLNGSGKTHLLEAIKRGDVKCDAVAVPDLEIAFYDWATIVPSDTHPVDMGQQMLAYKNDLRNSWDTIEYNREIEIQDLSRTLTSAGFEISHEQLVSLINKESFSKEHQKIVDHGGKPQLNYQQFKNLLRDKALKVSRSRGLIQFPGSQRLANEHPEQVLFSGLQNFLENDVVNLGRANAFEQKLSERFGVYRELYGKNAKIEGLNLRGKTDKIALTDEEFFEKYGEPPWEFINRILRDAGIKFELVEPDLENGGPIDPILRKVGSSEAIKFQMLSSGEKVLMTFALFIYNHLDERQGIKYPKLVLLDEVDAPLHPSMVRFLVETIKTKIVKELGIPVILTTHSPTTISLVDEQSLHIVKARPDEGPEVCKCSQQQALNSISSGVPAMAISFENRRQIFCESSKDAEVFSLLYEAHKAEISGEYSLNFISVGSKSTNNQEINAGCGKVKQMVETLRRNGAESIFGLIDWDQTNKEQDGIHVHSFGERYSLENLILDPALVIQYLAKLEEDTCRRRGLIGPSEGFTALASWEQSQFQGAVNSLTLLVLKNSGNDTTNIKYRNGMSLDISKDWLTMNGHDLQQELLNAIPELKGSQHKNLLPTIIGEISFNAPQWFPVSIGQLFGRMMR